MAERRELASGVCPGDHRTITIFELFSHPQKRFRRDVNMRGGGCACSASGHCPHETAVVFRALRRPLRVTKINK